MSRPTFEELAAPIAEHFGISVAEVGEMSVDELRAAVTRLVAKNDQMQALRRDLGEVAQ